MNFAINRIGRGKREEGSVNETTNSLALAGTQRYYPDLHP